MIFRSQPYRSPYFLIRQNMLLFPRPSKWANNGYHYCWLCNKIYSSIVLLKRHFNTTCAATKSFSKSIVGCDLHYTPSVAVKVFGGEIIFSSFWQLCGGEETARKTTLVLIICGFVVSASSKDLSTLERFFLSFALNKTDGFFFAWWESFQISGPRFHFYGITLTPDCYQSSCFLSVCLLPSCWLLLYTDAVNYILKVLTFVCLHISQLSLLAITIWLWVILSFYHFHYRKYLRHFIFGLSPSPFHMIISEFLF